jgi:hypothetical protein
VRALAKDRKGASTLQARPSNIVSLNLPHGASDPPLSVTTFGGTLQAPDLVEFMSLKAEITLRWNLQIAAIFKQWMNLKQTGIQSEGVQKGGSENEIAKAEERFCTWPGAILSGFARPRTPHPSGERQSDERKWKLKCRDGQPVRKPSGASQSILNVLASDGGPLATSPGSAHGKPHFQAKVKALQAMTFPLSEKIACHDCIVSL